MQGICTRIHSFFLNQSVAYGTLKENIREEFTMNEIEAIRQRHSVRAYKDEPIAFELQMELKTLLQEINEVSGLNFQFLEDAEKTFTKLLNRALGLGSAPSVIACMGPDKDDLDEQIGYWGEKIVIMAQMMGLNTCWAGTFSREKIPVTVPNGQKLAIVIAIGYGANPGRVRKSKTPQQVSVAHKDAPEWFTFGVEMALLAPTAINQQKFEIVLNEDDSVSFVDKGGVLSKIDLGIVKYHFEVGAQSKQEN